MPLVYSCEGMPTIERFFSSDAFFRGLMGPFGSGKSSACCIELGQRGVAQRPLADGVRRSRWAVIRNTFRQLEDTTIRTFLQWFPPHQFGDWVPSKHQYVIRALRAEGDDRGAEIEVMFRALDRPDQLGNLLSLDLTGAWVNEGREIPWTIFEALEGRVGRFPRMADGGPTWQGIFTDTNAPDVDSEWYKFFEERDLSEHVAELAKTTPGLTVDTYRTLFKQPSGLSPKAENLKNLPVGYYPRLAIGKDPEWVKVYIHGEYGFVVEGKPVWPGYNDTLHCPADKRLWPKPISGLPILRSWDFGLTPACVLSQITPRGQWIVFDELTSSSMGADKFSDEVLDHCAREYSHEDFQDVGDPAGMQRAQSDEKTCFQILHAKSIGIEPALQTLAIRIESVAKPLRTLVDGGYPQFVLHPRCKVLRRALMGGYHFRRMRISGERYAENPEKNHYSHVADALGYGGTRMFGASLRAPVDDGGSRGRYGEFLDDRSRSAVTGY
jgi:hypothetical protein